MKKTSREKNGACTNCGLTVNGMTPKAEAQILNDAEDAKNGIMKNLTDYATSQLSPMTINQCKECLQRHYDEQKASVPSIRDKGRKTDAELYEEYFGPILCYSSMCHGESKSSRPCTGKCTGIFRETEEHRKERIDAIEKELGTEKILGERVRRLEEKIANQKAQKVPSDTRIIIIVGAVTTLTGVFYILMS